MASRTWEDVVSTLRITVSVFSMINTAELADSTNLLQVG
jgi:hypothetical protein